jgi:transcriptional regulator with XRE-family HTH domain
MSEQPDGDVPDWDLADRMRKALRHAGMSPGQMADYLGVSRQSVGNWISGRVEPSFQTLRLWSIRTGVSLEWLLGRVLVPAGGFTMSRSLTASDDAEVARVRALPPDYLEVAA